MRWHRFKEVHTVLLKGQRILALAHLDDVVVHSNCIREQLRHVRTVLKLLLSAEKALKLSESFILDNRVLYPIRKIQSRPLAADESS